MNKSNLLGSVAGVLAMTVGAFAGVDGVIMVNDQSIANAASYANAFTLNGKIAGVSVKIEDCASAVRTNTVTITSADGQTLFSAAVVGTCTNFYPLAVPLYGTDAALINSSTVASTTNKVYASAPVASKVTCTVTGVAFPTLTNNVTVKILVDR
jgi:hypothetical protein